MRYRSLTAVFFYILCITPQVAAQISADSSLDAPDDSSTALTDLSIEDLAQMSLEELMDIRIEVSSTQAETIFNIPSIVTIVDTDTIESYGFVSMSEALQTIAGVVICRTSWMRDIPTIRGIQQDHFTNKVLILIDGVPNWMAVTGEGYINRVSIEDVERIEVLRGPASVLYGTNAYGRSD